MYFNTFIIVFCAWFGLSLTQSSCRTPNGEISHCVTIYNCKLFIDTIASKTITPQINKFFRESACGDYANGISKTVTVCCGSFINYEDDETNETITITTTTTTAARTTTTTTIRTTTAIIEEEEAPNKQCGRTYGNDYLGKPNMLKINEHPWAALIEYKNNQGKNIGHKCGGVLVYKNFVLTAAHCLTTEKFGTAFQVRLGEYDRSRTQDCDRPKTCYDNHQDILINKTLIHPEYNNNNGSYINDIALIKLEESAVFSDFIRPVCLTQTKGPIFHTGTELFVVGWGLNENSSGERTKHQVKALAIPDEQCTVVNPMNMTLSPRQFCAVKSGVEETIQYCGDTGGGILKQILENNETIFALQGIESFSFNENTSHKNYIIVYTNVSEYINWIMKTMRL